MASLNLCQFIGNVGSIDARVTPKGESVTTISLAVNESWKDKETGEKKQKTEWVKVIMWKRLAEIAKTYVVTGDPIYVQGKMQTRKYQDNGVDKYITEVIATEMKMLGSRREGEPNRELSEPADIRPGGFETMADDIPF
jgi:single-strand DNA-binding protein